MLYRIVPDFDAFFVIKLFSYPNLYFVYNSFIINKQKIKIKNEIANN